PPEIPRLGGACAGVRGVGVHAVPRLPRAQRVRGPALRAAGAHLCPAARAACRAAHSAAGRGAGIARPRLPRRGARRRVRLVRAALSLASDKVQGGSTLTQQLVKNFVLTPERTLQRKLTELIMAVLLELHYDKTEILETYLNEIYFGQDRDRAIHGIGLAAQFYFGKEVQHLTLAEAALLVGLVKGPAYYDPYRHPQRALERRN